MIDHCEQLNKNKISINLSYISLTADLYCSMPNTVLTKNRCYLLQEKGKNDWICCRDCSISGVM